MLQRRLWTKLSCVSLSNTSNDGTCTNIACSLHGSSSGPLEDFSAALWRCVRAAALNSRVAYAGGRLATHCHHAHNLTR